MFESKTVEIKRCRYSQNNSFSFGIDDPNIWLQINYVNLSNSNITTLPREFGALPHLERLVLSNNNIGASGEFNWHWLQPTAIKNNLRFLDLSNNLLTELPTYIGELKALTELILCHNSLKCLQQSIAKLQNLKVLKSSNNELLYLPGSMINMQLNILDVSKNDFLSIRVSINHINFPLTLFVAAAKVVLQYRLDRSLPNTFCEHLKIYLTEYCLYCYEACFDSYVKKIMQLDIIFSSVAFLICDKQEALRFECYYCSPHCFKMWKAYYQPLPFEYQDEEDEDEGYEDEDEETEDAETEDEENEDEEDEDEDEENEDEENEDEEDEDEDEENEDEENGDEGNENDEDEEDKDEEDEDEEDKDKEDEEKGRK